MHNDERDGVIVDVADALTLGQRVHWNRCRRLAKPDERQALDNLRTLDRLFAGRRAARPAATDAPAAGPEPYTSAFVRRSVQALIAVAAIEVAATLMLLPWAWSDYHREHGDVAVFMATKLVGDAATACLLLGIGRGDRRTWLLGVYSLFKGTLASLHILLAILGEIPQPEVWQTFDWEPSAGARVFAYFPHPFFFCGAFLWAFARECPRVHRRTALDELARHMVGVSVALGCAVWVACAAAMELAQAGYTEVPVLATLDAGLVILDLLALGAVVVVALRAHTAPAAEVRRVVLFCVGCAAYQSVWTLHDLAEVFAPGQWLSNYQRSPTVVLAELLRFPGTVLLWYSVLAARVPHVREVGRAFFTRLLVRPTLLSMLSAVPAVALGWQVASRPERSIGAVVADPLVQALAAGVIATLLLLAARKPVLGRLDSWLYPGTTDQRSVLAAAMTALARAERLATVSRTASRAVMRGCGAPAKLLIPTATETGDLHAPDAKLRPLARNSAIVQLLETTAGALRVHPNDRKSFFALLPPDDEAWVVETDADAIAPVPGPGAELVGVLVAGRRFDGRTVRAVDVPFLETLAAAAGLAVVRLRPADGRGSDPLVAPAARECPVCGCVTEAGDSPECDCGSTYAETAAPKLLEGRYLLIRRLGAGGMGKVYLARDQRLERDVAVKTFAGLSVRGLMRMKPEAWAMATATHPAVAQVYSIESWRGRPFLVVEFLAGGTLADRLQEGPMPAWQAVSMALQLADALGALHESGYLHGDVKPSNVGFTSRGLPKLLDFGLARGSNDFAAPGGGTLRYVSPEVLSGSPAGEADDVWSLCVVLYETVLGEQPFACDNVDETAERIRRQRLVRHSDATVDSETAAVIAFAASILTAPRAARPATARAFAGALRGALPSD